MGSNGDSVDVAAVFQDIGDLEKEFADVELDALLRKEHALKPLYTKRTSLLDKIPDFWPQIFLNGPEEIQQLFSPADLPVLSSIKNFAVERYQIDDQGHGEPRSLRFTFTFQDNEHLEAQTLVKEFEYKPSEHGAGNLVSKPVAIKWKTKKKDLTNGLLDLAADLETAEASMKLKKGGQEVELVDREGLWQYEKLREKVRQQDEETAEQPSFLNWFGFRGAVVEPEKADDGEHAEDEEDDDGMLDVEIFPPGEEVAICLAEDLWPSVMDYFMRAQDEDVPDLDDLDDEMDEDSEGDAPELVAEDEEFVEMIDDRPKKRQRKA